MTEETETKETSFAIVVSPEFDKEGKWTGVVGCHMEEEVNHALNDDELTQIRSVCGMMATTLTIMEQDEDFLEYVKEAFLAMNSDMVEDFMEALEKDEKPNFTKDGNVFTLNFDSKTHGSA